MKKDDKVAVFSAKDSPYGKPWAEWTTMWWQWILSIPKDQNPGTGHNILQNQSDENVLFLAGSFGGFIEHNVTVQSGKALLFPIINFTTSYAEDPHFESDEDLIREAKKDMDDITEKEVTLNDIPQRDLELCRIFSGPFDLNYPPENVFNALPGLTRAVSDGYWLFLRPLPKGAYKIHTLGACSSGRTKVDVVYHLIVI